MAGSARKSVNFFQHDTFCYRVPGVEQTGTIARILYLKGLPEKCFVPRRNENGTNENKMGKFAPLSPSDRSIN
jgi:hypothetical protein